VNGNGANGNGKGRPDGHSRWIVPDEGMLARLANDVMRQLASEAPSGPAVRPAKPDLDQPVRMTPDLLDLPVSTTESDMVQAAPAPPAMRTEPARVPRPPAGPRWEPAPSPTFYFIAEHQDPGPPAAAAPASLPPFSIEAIRRDFPILAERVNGHPLVWFDNAATTQKPQCVIDRLTRFYARENSNIHRGAHALASQATDAYEAARSTVASFIGAPAAENIIFTRGTTESINLIARTWGRANIGQGDEIVVSHLEHHANIVPWQQLADETGARLRVIPVNDNGELMLDALSALLTDRTKLVAVAHVSNVLGTIVPVGEVIALAHQAGARVLVDGAQAVAHTPVSVRQLDADFYVFSGHKIFAPTGIGALYGKAELLDEMPPWQGGGNMIDDVTFERTRYQPAPARFEAGTGNIAGAIGLGTALGYVSSIGLPAISAYEHQLLGYATQQILAVPGLRLLGTAKDKASVLTFRLDGHEAAGIGAELDRQGIAVRSGHHCAQPILRRYGLEDAVRPSLAMYNTCAEVDQLVSALHKITAGR
jgi:cysteine desulfurase/selenocysteine lyase